MIDETHPLIADDTADDDTARVVRHLWQHGHIERKDGRTDRYVRLLRYPAIVAVLGTHSRTGRALRELEARAIIDWENNGEIWLNRDQLGTSHPTSRQHGRSTEP